MLLAWAQAGKPLPGPKYAYHAKGLAPIAAESLSLNKNWRDYDIAHPLTEAGLAKFAADWNSLIDMDSSAPTIVAVAKAQGLGPERKRAVTAV